MITYKQMVIQILEGVEWQESAEWRGGVQKQIRC